jgi:sigma54-dependent transcription regulator
MLRVRRMRPLRKFASVHASVASRFNQERDRRSTLLFKASRAGVRGGWRELSAASIDSVSVLAVTGSRSSGSTGPIPAACKEA